MAYRNDDFLLPLWEGYGLALSLLGMLGLLNSGRFYWLDRSLNSWTKVNETATPWDMIFSWRGSRAQEGERTKANYASPLKLLLRYDICHVHLNPIGQRKSHNWAQSHCSGRIQFAYRSVARVIGSKKLWANNVIYHNLSPMFVKTTISPFIILISL